MRRTTIKLPDELDAKLRFEAERRGTTISQISREAIEAYLNGGRRRRLLAAGAGESGIPDLAANIDHYLEVFGFGRDSMGEYGG